MQDSVRLSGIVKYPRSTSEIKGTTKKIAKLQLSDKSHFQSLILKYLVFFSNILHIIACILHIYC